MNRDYHATEFIGRLAADPETKYGEANGSRRRGESRHLLCHFPQKGLRGAPTPLVHYMVAVA